MTAKTPIYQLEYLVQGEPARNTRLALENNAKSIEAALQARGVAAVGASDLLAVSGRVTTLEGSTPAAVQFVDTTGAATGWANFLTTGSIQFQPFRVWKSGRTIYTTGVVKNATAIAAGAEQNVGIIPVGLRPTGPVSGGVVGRHMFTTTANGTTICRLDVYSTGMVTCSNNTAASIAAGAYIPANLHWTVD